MNLPELVRQRIAEARQGLEALVWRLLFFTRVSATSADGGTDGVEGWPETEGDPASPQQTVRRMEPWGVHGRPAAGVYALIARVLGGAASGLQVGIWTGKHGRQDLAEGETQLYSGATGAEVWLDKDGNNRINSASGRDVAVNGGTLKVFRDTDPTDNGTLVMSTVSAVGPPVVDTVTFSWSPPGGGAPSVLGSLVFTSGLLTSATTSGSVALTGKANGGAPRFKA